MRLLVCAQTVDTKDPFNGFFVEWIRELASRFEYVTVISLGAGEYSLPSNVTIYPLGKELARGPQFLVRLNYTLRLLALSWKNRRKYDAVLVHQSQEFILSAGWLWFLLQKPIYLWRNHYAGNILTDVAASLSKKVFYTSHFSYTAKYPHAVCMPVGVDVGKFAPDESIARIPHSILFLGRITLSKRPHMLLQALRILRKKNIQFSAAFFGSSLPSDLDYREELVAQATALGLQDVTFQDGIPHADVPYIFNQYEIYVNLAESGMLDKTIFEAAACGAIPIAASRDYADFAGVEFFFEDESDLAEKVERFLAMTVEGKRARRFRLRELVIQKHSLRELGEQLYVLMRKGE